MGSPTGVLSASSSSRGVGVRGEGGVRGDGVSRGGDGSDDGAVRGEGGARGVGSGVGVLCGVDDLRGGVGVLRGVGVSSGVGVLRGDGGVCGEGVVSGEGDLRGEEVVRGDGVMCGDDNLSGGGGDVSGDDIMRETSHTNSVEIDSRMREDHEASTSLNLPAKKSVLPPGNSILNSRGASAKPLYSSVVDKRNDLPSFTVDFPVVSGVVKAAVPDKVRKDTKPLWTDLIVGRFQNKAPRYNAIHYIVNKIWLLGDKDAKIEVFKINDRLFKFRIQSDSARSYILRRGMWNIAGQPMVVSKWSPIEEDSNPSFRVLPMWVTLKDVPRDLFTREGLGWLAGAAGHAKHLHPDTLQCKSFEEAKVFVDVNLEKELVTEFEVEGYSKPVIFKYPWLPKRCSICSQWGHVQSKCANPVDEVAILRKEASGIRAETTTVEPSTQKASVDIANEVEEGEIRVETEATRIMDEVINELAVDLVNGLDKENEAEEVITDKVAEEIPCQAAKETSVFSKSYAVLIQEHNRSVVESSMENLDHQPIGKIGELETEKENTEKWSSPTKISRTRDVTIRRGGVIDLSSQFHALSEMGDVELEQMPVVCSQEKISLPGNSSSSDFKRTTRSTTRKNTSAATKKVLGQLSRNTN